ESVHIPENELEHHMVSAEAKSKEAAEILEEAAEMLEEPVTTDTPRYHPGNDSEHEDHSIHVASWQWDYVRTPFIYTAVVIVAGLCKIGKEMSFPLRLPIGYLWVRKESLFLKEYL
ncbi:hypothetical protein AVEN_191232-1, partial [Araneus ventricosus]